MANRSHVYVTDVVPTAAENGAPRGICEYNYDIPLAHRVLVGNQPRQCVSAIWPEHEIAIIGEAAGAYERLAELVRVLGEGDVPKRKEFDRAVAQMHSFFAADAAKGRYFLLEAGELFDAEGDLEGGVQRTLRGIPAAVADAEAMIAGKANAKLTKLRAAWETELGIGWFSSVLYYSFKAR